MSLIANINTDVNGNIIIQMRGTLNYDINLPLKDELLNISKEHPLSHITLDFTELDFVGSSGIGQFVELINRINRDKIKLYIMNVKTEFIKVFGLYKLEKISEVIVTSEIDETNQSLILKKEQEKKQARADLLAGRTQNS